MCALGVGNILRNHDPNQNPNINPDLALSAGPWFRLLNMDLPRVSRRELEAREHTPMRAYGMFSRTECAALQAYVSTPLVRGNPGSKPYKS